MEAYSHIHDRHRLFAGHPTMLDDAGRSSPLEDTDSNSHSPTQEEPSSTTPGRKQYPDYCRTLQVRDSNGAVKELVFPKALDLDRPKRARTTFSAEQLYKLEREFQRNQYLVGRERTDLAINLQLSETQVKVWFQNRRTKYKRDNTRQADERKQHAEGLAACNILRMLQHSTPPSAGGASAKTSPPPPTGVAAVPPHPATSLPSHVPPPILPPIPIALSITNRPPGELTSSATSSSPHHVMMTSSQRQTIAAAAAAGGAHAQAHFRPGPPQVTHAQQTATVTSGRSFHFPAILPPPPPPPGIAPHHHHHHALHGAFASGFYGAS